MGRSTVPRGARMKQRCSKCNRLYYNFIEKGKTETRNICVVCKPIRDDDKKQN